MKKIILIAFVLMLFFLASNSQADAASKFIQVYRDGSRDMYVNTASIIQIKGITSFWVKSVYSVQGKAALKSEVPQKLRKTAFEYGLDYFQYDLKKNKYNIKICSLYADSKEVYREGNKKWLPLRNGTIAADVLAKVNEHLESKKD